MAKGKLIGAGIQAVTPLFGAEQMPDITGATRQAQPVDNTLLYVVGGLLAIAMLGAVLLLSKK